MCCWCQSIYSWIHFEIEIRVILVFIHRPRAAEELNILTVRLRKQARNPQESQSCCKHELLVVHTFIKQAMKVGGALMMSVTSLCR